MHDVIIIGGMAAGCKAAARLSRLSPDFQITIIEKGSFLSFSSCGLPFFAAGEISELSDLNKTSYGILRDENFFCKIKGVKVLTNTEVLEINAESSLVKCSNLNLKKEYELKYDYLIIATGSTAIKPNFPLPSSPLISSFHTPDDSKYFRQAAQKGNIEKAVIIGGGFIGCEMIEAISSLWGIKTALIEKENSLLSSILDPEISRFVQSGITSGNVEILLSTSVNKIEINEKGLPVVFLNNGSKIESDYVFYCLGVKPNSGLAEKAKIKIGSKGGVLVDEEMRTNIPDIWAAGDCVEIKNLVTGKRDYFSFGSLSNRMGRAAADSIYKISSRKDAVTFKGSAGTVSLKLFENIICASGVTENKAKTLGYKTGCVTGCWYDRPDYNPESKNILGKLVYERPGLKLLGLQLIGEGEVTRYIDTFSELLSQNKNVKDLLEVEHCYTPAHSSPVSPLNYLGYMALNQENDSLMNYNPLMLSSFAGIIIDVREPSEINNMASACIKERFPGRYLQIALSGLRDRIGDFDIEQQIIFICEKGTRAYEAARMFSNSGYKNVAYLGGGYLLYENMNMSIENREKLHETR